MSKKLPARFWAITNGGGWGEGFHLSDAVKRAVKGSWGTKGKAADGLEINVWELDPAKPVTHTSDASGHALNVPKDAKRDAFGRLEGEQYCYKRNDKGEIIKPKYFRYQKGAHSDAGPNFTRVELQ